MRLLALLTLAPALLAGCATPPAPEPDAATARSVELRSVPFHAQERFQCGPAALAMVIEDLGLEVDPEALRPEVYVPAREGSLPPEMRAAARERGLVPYPFAGSIDEVITAVDAGYPVLVMQNLALDWWPVWHYAVVVGYDLDEATLLLRSGTNKRHTTTIATFQRTWQRADKWAQIVVQPDDIPHAAQRLRWLEAVHELEETGHNNAARTGYRSATREWPLYQPAWMAYGNAAWQADDSAAAVAAFRRAAVTAPGAWDGWNNLAHALAHSGCGVQAERAARCAAALAPAGAASATASVLPDATHAGNCAALPPCAAEF